MVWTAHKPANCMLGKQHKKEQKKKPQKSNSGTVAATAAAELNTQFAALMATLAGLEE
jgi:hypothetical protein